MRALLCLPLVLLLGASPLLAQERRDWDDLYRDAIALISKEQWKAAEDVLTRAMKAGPPSGRGVIRRGMFGRDDYFPEYYLGIIYLFTNRPTEAQTQFQVARKRGINVKEKEFAALAQYEARARELIDIDTKNRATADRNQQFKRLLGEAQKLLAGARFDDAEAAARQARELNVDNGTVDTVLQNVQKARATVRLQEALKRNPSAADLRRLLAEYESAGIPLDDLRKRLESAELVERRNTVERTAMVAFYTGNYTQALNALTEAEKLLELTPRGHFYRAVALASQATRGKEVNQSLLQRARQAWQTASRNEDQFKPDLRYVSPQILRLLSGS